MSNIKTKEVIKGTIKTIDKGLVATQKTKENIVNVKEKSEKAINSEESNANEYATNRIKNTSKSIIDNSGKIKQIGNQSVRKTKENLVKAKQKIKTIKTKLAKKRI